MIDVFGAYQTSLGPGPWLPRLVLQLAANVGLRGGPGVLFVDQPPQLEPGQPIELDIPIELGPGQALVGVSSAPQGTVFRHRGGGPAITMADGSRLENLRLTARGLGIRIAGSDTLVRDVAVTTSATGIEVARGDRNRIDRVLVAGGLSIAPEATRTWVFASEFGLESNEVDAAVVDRGRDTRILRSRLSRQGARTQAGKPAAVVQLSGQRCMVSGCRLDGSGVAAYIHNTPEARHSTFEMNRYGEQVSIARTGPAPEPGPGHPLLIDEGVDSRFRDHARAGFPTIDLSPENLIFNGAFTRWRRFEHLGPEGWETTSEVAEPVQLGWGAIVRAIDSFREEAARRVPPDDPRLFIGRTKVPGKPWATEDALDAGLNQRGHRMLLAQQEGGLYERSADVLSGESSVVLGVFPRGGIRTVRLVQKVQVHSVTKQLVASGYVKFKRYVRDDEPPLIAEDGRPGVAPLFSHAWITARVSGGAWVAPTRRFVGEDDWALTAVTIELPQTGVALVQVEVALEIVAYKRPIEAMFDRVQLNHGTTIPRFTDNVLPDAGGLFAGLTFLQGAYVEFKLESTDDHTQPGDVVDAVRVASAAELVHEVLVLYRGRVVPAAGFIDVRLNGKPLFATRPCPTYPYLNTAKDCVLAIPSTAIDAARRQLAPGDILTLHQVTVGDPPASIRIRGQRRSI